MHTHARDECLVRRWLHAQRCSAVDAPAQGSQAHHSPSTTSTVAQMLQRNHVRFNVHTSVCRGQCRTEVGL